MNEGTKSGSSSEKIPRHTDTKMCSIILLIDELRAVQCAAVGCPQQAEGRRLASGPVRRVQAVLLLLQGVPDRGLEGGSQGGVCKRCVARNDFVWKAYRTVNASRNCMANAIALAVAYAMCYKVTYAYVIT